MPDKIKVLVVDDHEMVRLGLISFLETEPDFVVVGEASNGAEAVMLASKVQPDVILMDLVMDDIDGITATKKIITQFPAIKIIVLTSYIDDELVYPALEAGAISYLLKTARAQEIADAVRAAVRGEAVVDAKVLNKLVQRNRSGRLPHEDLTERERQVLALIADGKTNQEIAECLCIGLKTVKTHVSNILAKLGVSDRTQAAVYAHRHGLVRDK